MTSRTPRELITAALKELGVLGLGQTLSAEYAADALLVLQRLFDAWKIHPLTKPTQLRTTHTLTSGTRDYTIGVAATINIVKPAAIERAAVILNTSVTDPIETPIKVFSPGEWAGVSMKTFDAGTIDGIYYDKLDGGIGLISTYPTINVGTAQLVLYTLQQVPVNGFAAIDTAYLLPDGAELALHYQFAKALCRPFGRPLTADLEQDARQTLRDYQLSNVHVEEMGLDYMAASLGRSNIYTDL